VRQYSGVLARIAREESLLPFHKSAVAAVIEHGARIAARRGKLTARFSRVADIAREAAFLAKNGGKKAVLGEDVLVTGAEPLLFLDYYATGHLEVDIAERVINGIARACELAGCALAGGETAEMPGFYRGGDYDVAGFCIGVVERSRIVDGRSIAPEHVLIGLPSSGPHSNGYSLIRSILERAKPDLAADFQGRPLGEVLLEPTRIYVKPMLALMQELPVKAMAHITGGGLVENLPRVLPESLKAVIYRSSWKLPPLFEWLQREGGVADAEMQRVFNCGVGMAVVVTAKDADLATRSLTGAGETVFRLGCIEARSGTETQVVLA